jgi:putative transposase
VRSETRKIQQAYRFELDPNRAQGVLLAKSVGAARYVYNWGLAESKRQYEVTGKRPRLGLSATITRRADRWGSRGRAAAAAEAESEASAPA